jgi:hypothetical protein
MYAGDDQDFTFNVFDSASQLVDLNGATCSANIFRYGDASYNIVALTGTITASPTLGQFTAQLTSACSITMSGVYSIQPVVLDYLGKKHIPAQGKVIVFPSPNV